MSSSEPGGSDLEKRVTAPSPDAIHTLRTVHQNQTQHVILADQKANVLIGIVAVILTILFAGDNIPRSGDGVFVALFAGFIAFEIAALVFALMAIMPSVNGRSSGKDLHQARNPFFFGNYTRFTEGEFTDFVCESVKDNLAARRLLTRDIYQIGHVLKKKYLLVKCAYLFSLVGVMMMAVALVVSLFAAT